MTSFNGGLQLPCDWVFYCGMGIYYSCMWHLHIRLFLFLDRNECLEILCLNGGTCNNLIGGYECVDCNAGWTGKLCEIGRSKYQS